MITKVQSKGEKLNWKPLKTVAPVRISAKNLKGNKVGVSSNSSNKRVVIS